MSSTTPGDDITATPPEGDHNTHHDFSAEAIPDEIVAPMIRYMSARGLGAMELRIEAVEADPSATDAPKTATAVLEPDLTCYETPEAESLDGGVFITATPLL